MKKILTSFFILAAIALARGQNTLTIQQCYARAEESYPLIVQRDLIAKTTSFSIDNASSGNLPRISIGGQATYQSDVTSIPLEMPGVEPLSKDQYRIFAEVSQSLYHGGMVEQQKDVAEADGAVESKKLEVELYQLRQRIDELFFGILLLREQRRQSELVKEDLASAMKKVEASIENGTALRTAADALQAEVLYVDQRMIELEAAEGSFREILGTFINQTVDRGTVLEKPSWSVSDGTIDRPELGLFDLQKRSIEVSRGLLSAGKKPGVELFVQGGYGRPALNMLENNFELYYLGGIRFNWLLSGLYTFRRQKQILDLRQQSIEAQKETFLFNTRMISDQQRAEVVKLQRLIEVDDEIISLRARVQKTASVQLEEGVISASDYIRDVNASGQAKQARALHETQLLMAQARHRFTTGHE